MGAVNRREVLQLAAACGLGAVIGEAGFSKHAIAADTPSAPGDKEAPIKTRMFWTWDHSTEWALNRPGAHTLVFTHVCRGFYTYSEEHKSLDSILLWRFFQDDALASFGCQEIMGGRFLKTEV